MPRKVTIAVHLEPDQADQLRELSERTRVPRAVYVRKAIAALLEDYGDRAWQGGFGVANDNGEVSDGS